MLENTVAKILRGIGIATIIIGIIASFILANEEDSLYIFVVGLAGSIISGVLFIGFSEVIHLLQENSDKQDSIIRTLTKIQKQTNVASENSQK